MSQVGFLQTTLSPFFLPNLLGKPARLDENGKYKFLLDRKLTIFSSQPLRQAGRSRLLGFELSGRQIGFAFWPRQALSATMVMMMMMMKPYWPSQRLISMWLSLKSNLKLKGDLASLHRQGVTVHGTFAKVVIII